MDRTAAVIVEKFFEWFEKGIGLLWGVVCCYVFNKHHWRQVTIGYMDMKTGGIEGGFRCKFCGKVHVGTMYLK